MLGAAGIASEIAESAPGRANLMARQRGDGSAGGIVLHHHIAEKEQGTTRCYAETLLAMAGA